MLLILSYIFGGIVYSFIYKFSKPKIKIDPPKLEPNLNSNFIECNLALIDTVNQVITPAFVGLSFIVWFTETTWIVDAAAYGSLFQSIFFLLAIFLTRGSEESCYCYLKCAPWLIWVMSFIALCVMPIIGITVLII